MAKSLTCLSALPVTLPPLQWAAPARPTKYAHAVTYQAPCVTTNNGRICTCGWRCTIAVQSMTNTETCDIAATVGQIQLLERAGADIVRVSVPSLEAAEAFGEIRKQVNVPLVADIHFDYRIAL